MIGFGDPQFSGVGREAIASSFDPVGPETTLIDLDGTWEFHLAPSPAPWLDGSAEPDASDWTAIEVPGCWTRQGHDAPHYTNVIMPWPLDPPSVPAENPTGLYRRTVTVEPGESDVILADRTVILEIGGAESFVAVWWNGVFIGSGKDSRLPHHFDVTRAARAGENRLTFAVVRYCDGTWLEDQDHWWHAGLHRSVRLFVRPKTRLADVAVTAGLAQDGSTGTLGVRATIEGTRPGLTVRAELLGAGESTLWRAEGPVGHFLRDSALQQMAMAYLYRGPVGELQGEVPDVAPWTHETPSLYRLRVELADESGTIETTTLRIGFRRVEIAGRELRINGRAVLIRGVNRHDHHPEHGKTQSADDIRHDLLTIKRFGFNAVRCAHYPNDPVLYDLCDELGLYVIDEANIESHARMNSLTQDPRWHAALFERFTRMVLRDRNHPSIIGWSLGNESGYAPVHDAMAAWARATDPSRFVQYEGASFHTSLDGGERASDVVCPMYASIEDIVAWSERNATDRPLILCEYSHAMGNSNGNLADYWEAIESHPGLQGGFIWDFKDQGLWLERDGRRFLGFGGHFGDEPNDANFCCNGIFGPECEPRPAAWEHKQLAAPVRARLVDETERTVALTNRRDFTRLGEMTCRFELSDDGNVVDTGRLALPDLAPGETGELIVPWKEPGGVGGERRLTLFFEDGDEDVCFAQLPLPPGPGALAEAPSDASLTLDGAVPLADGRALLATRIEPTLWRAAIDNDGVKQGPRPPKILDTWLAWGLDRLEAQGLGEEEENGAVLVRGRWKAPDVAEAFEHERTIRRAGDRFAIEERFEIPEAWNDLPRVGVTFRVEPRFDRLRWFGLGPHETYPDRIAGARLGIFEETVGVDDFPYLVPQEFGGHCATRWFRLQDAAGAGLEIRLPEPLQFSATRFGADDLWRARDLAELEPADAIVVHIDVAHRGVGTGACGPDTSHRISGGSYAFRWELRPLG